MLNMPGMTRSFWGYRSLKCMEITSSTSIHSFSDRSCLTLVSGTGWDINGWLSSNSSSSLPPRSSSSSSSSSSSLSLLDVELCLELVSLLDPWSLWCWCWDCSWNSWREKWRKCGADEGRWSSSWRGCGRGLGDVWQILCLQQTTNYFTTRVDIWLQKDYI